MQLDRYLTCLTLACYKGEKMALNPLAIERNRVKEEKDRIREKIRIEEENDERRRDILANVVAGIQNRKIDVINKYKDDFFTAKKRPDPHDFVEINTGEIRTDPSGFVSVSEQVRIFSQGGRTLNNIRDQNSLNAYADKNQDQFSDESLKMYPSVIETIEIVADLRRRGEDTKNENIRLYKEQKRAEELQKKEERDAKKNRDTASTLDTTAKTDNISGRKTDGSSVIEE